MGGADRVLEKARDAFDRGEYRWVAEVVNHVVFADPENEAARALQADSLEQLGYQSESGPWRNFYLTGASELRNGVPDIPVPTTASADNVSAMSMELFFDYLAMRLNGAKAGDRRTTVVCTLPDPGETWTLLLRQATLSNRAGADAGADATLTIDRVDLNSVILGDAELDALIGDGTASVAGDSRAFGDLLDLLDDFRFWFNIVTP
jgi:alkyl sulfatase BDS1-like metallo-beta-lactamase superfamily hydrolase